jgi:hypothetical protein
MQKTEDKKIKRIIELLNSPLKEGVHVLVLTDNEILIEYKGKVYNQDSIKIK